jgi:DeoR family transcriptional regulator, fructose operon transcriptional repressor
MINSVSADLLIMGIRGITEHGISDSNSLIVESLRAMIRSAQKVVLVADHTKFGHNAMIDVESLDNIDLVVSDTGLSAEYQKMLKDHGVECLLA